MPRGVLGLRALMFQRHLRFIVNRRAQRIELEVLFGRDQNLFPWMSEMAGQKK